MTLNGSKKRCRGSGCDAISRMLWNSGGSVVFRESRRPRLEIVGNLETRFPGNLGARGKFHGSFLDKKRKLKKKKLISREFAIFPDEQCLICIIF